MDLLVTPIMAGKAIYKIVSGSLNVDFTENFEMKSVFACSFSRIRFPKCR